MTAMRPRILLSLLVVAAVFLGACKRSADTKPLDTAGVGYSIIKDLEQLEVSEDEVTQIVKARAAGISDRNCLELLKLARSRGAPFAEGFAAANLRSAKMSEEGIMELGRLNHLGFWAGEAHALLLAGFHERTVLELARRRAKGLPTLSSPSVAKLRNEGRSEENILELIRSGLTDSDVEGELNRLPSAGRFRRR